jgi:hypothetical protein
MSTLINKQHKQTTKRISFKNIPFLDLRSNPDPVSVPADKINNTPTNTDTDIPHIKINNPPINTDTDIPHIQINNPPINTDTDIPHICISNSIAPASSNNIQYFTINAANTDTTVINSHIIDKSIEYTYDIDTDDHLVVLDVQPTLPQETEHEVKMLELQNCITKLDEEIQQLRYQIKDMSGILAKVISMYV